MAAPPIIVIWIASGQLANPASDAIGVAVRNALQNQSEVRLIAEPRDAGTPPTLDPRTAVVRVRWDANDPEHARLSCYWPGTGRWVERDVAFDPGDPAQERGRALGFVIASMATESETPEARPSSPPGSSDGREQGAGERERSAPSPAPSLSLSAGAEAAAAGAGTGYGAWVGGSHAVFGTRFWAGASARARFGSLPEAQATTRFLALAGELTWLAYRPSARSWLGVRSGLFLSRLTITHFSDDDLVPDEEGRWLPGAELAAHAELAFTPAAGVFGDVGAELLAGSTEVWVRHRLVAVWPTAGCVLRFGIQTRF